MLVYPQIDPIALSLGPLSIRWYGLMYLVAFLLFMALGRVRARSRPEFGMDGQAIDDLMFYGMLGVVLGGRLGQVLFFEPGYYFSHPLEIVAVWKGGMSFHGGFLGVLVAMALWAKRRGRTFFEVTDFIAPLVPLGLAAGRIGNFINGELWGRIADPALPWAMVFPHVDPLPRHPSQLYQAGLEGVTLFVLLWLFARRQRATGLVSAMFLVGYGVFRFIAEFFRTPDEGIFGVLSFGLSMGQWLSVPMIVAGLVLAVMCQRKGASK